MIEICYFQDCSEFNAATSTIQALIKHQRADDMPHSPLASPRPIRRMNQSRSVTPTPSSAPMVPPHKSSVQSSAPSIPAHKMPIINQNLISSAPPIVSRHLANTSFQSHAPAVPAHKNVSVQQTSIHQASTSVRNLNTVVTHPTENTYGELVGSTLSKNMEGMCDSRSVRVTDQNSSKSVLAPKRLKDLSAPPLPPRKSVSPSSDGSRPVPLLPVSSVLKKQQLIANVQPNVKQLRDIPPIHSSERIEEKNSFIVDNTDRVQNNGNRSPLSNASSMINLSFQNPSQSAIPKKGTTNLLDIGRPNISSSRSSEDLTKFPINPTILSGTVFDFRHVADQIPFSERGIDGERKSSLGNQSGESNLFSVITGSTETISGIIDTRYEVLPPHRSVCSLQDPRMFSKPIISLNKNVGNSSSQQISRPLQSISAETRSETFAHPGQSGESAHIFGRQEDAAPQKSIARIQPMQSRSMQQQQVFDPITKQQFDAKKNSSLKLDSDNSIAHYENVLLDNKGLVVSVKKQQLPTPTNPVSSDSSTSCESSTADRFNPLTHNSMGQKLDDSSTSNVPYENINFDYIARLVSEGYPKDSVVRALGITRNDIEMACDILHEFGTKTVKCQNNNGSD